MSRKVAANVDLPAIFRTLDQGVCPGLILSDVAGNMLICSGYAVLISNDYDMIVISFAPIQMLDLEVLLTKDDSGGSAIWIPGSEWYLEAVKNGNM